MAPKRREGDGRYDLAEITRRVEREISRRGLLDKEVAAALGVSQGQFSHKLRMTKRSRFNINDCGKLADFFEAPDGWPFVEWGYAESIATAATQVAAMRRELEEMRREIDALRTRRN